MILVMFQLLVKIIIILLSVAFFTLMERKVLGYIQLRKGPNKVLISGFFQPLVDALKLISKDDFPVTWSNLIMYYVSPGFMMFLSMSLWIVIPCFEGKVNNNFSFLYMMMIYGMFIYSLLWSGWSSNSVYSSLGGVRCVSQSISYEVVFSFIMLSIMYLYSTFSLDALHPWGMVIVGLMSPFLFLISLITFIVELGRSPFDLPEGESELVSGYMTEYGGVGFIMIFISENMMIFFSSVILYIFFFNFKSSVISSIFIVIMIFLIVIIRSSFPRIRYDKLMDLCWKIITPLTLMLFNLMIFLIISL